MFTYIRTIGNNAQTYKPLDHIRRKMGPTYLDSNATTPIEPEVADLVMYYMVKEFGNSGSRTHEFGARAKKAVELARGQVSEVVGCDKGEVVFTSGATESNNLAILGLAAFAETAGKRHFITGATEHKAVLEPMEYLASQGFDLTVLPSGPHGFISSSELEAALRSDTGLVSLMHVNNETGVEQPLAEYTDLLSDHECYFHCDAAQGFGKVIEPLRDNRIDMISISGHKIYGPKGVGALVARRRRYKMPPLRPLMYGGGQERGLRPGTLPVFLIAGLGKAAELALREHDQRANSNRHIKLTATQALAPLKPKYHGDPDRVLPHVINLSVPGVNSEAALIALKDVAAISNGSACTSASYKASHVLDAMGLSNEDIKGALRISWSHLADEIDWAAVSSALENLR
jgi:cysteine desulfurase